MMVLLDGRQTGRTTKAMNWVSQGERTRGYPGWTRVLVVIHLQEEMRLKREYRERLEDFGHRVFNLSAWRSAIGVEPTTEVCIDNLELMLGWNDLLIPGRVAAITLSGEPWVDVPPHMP